MKQLLILLVCSTAAFISCSAISVNSCQDARAIEPGKVQSRVGLGLGADYFSEMVYPAGGNVLYDYSSIYSIPFRLYFTAGLRAGVLPHVDATQMFWLPILGPGLSAGSRTSLTINVAPKVSKLQYALLPAFLYYYSTVDTISIDNHHLYGVDLPLVFSYEINKYVAPFAGIAYSRNYLYVRNPTPYYPYETVVERLSINIGATAKFRNLSLSPDFALHEFITNGKTFRGNFTFGLTFGIGFWKEKEAVIDKKSVPEIPSPAVDEKDSLGEIGI